MSKWFSEDTDVIVDGIRLVQRFPDNLPLEKWGETYDRMRTNAAILAASKDLYDACKAGSNHMNGPALLRIVAAILESRGITSELTKMLRAKADAEEKAIRVAEGRCNAEEGKIIFQTIKIQIPDFKSA